MVIRVQKKKREAQILVEVIFYMLLSLNPYQTSIPTRVYRKTP